MGFFSKVWKGIKKGVKKIARGVKKTFKKIGKAFGKLGIVGQIGMMFLMPYAMGALSSFAGSALGTVGQWSANLLSKSGIGSKALGHALNMVHKAGTFAGKVYTTISDTITNAVDRVGNFAKGKGFTLSEGRTSIFAKGNERSLLSTEGYALPEATVPSTAPVVSDVVTVIKDTPPTGEFLEQIDLDSLAKDVDVAKQLAQTVPDTLGLEVDKPSLLEFDSSKVKMPSIKMPSVPDTGIVADRSFVDTIKEIPGAITEKIKSAPGDFVEGIKSYDPAKAATQTIDSIIYNKGMEVAGVDTTPDYIDNRTVVNVPEMYDVASMSPSVFKEVDFSLSKLGNPWMTNNYQYSDMVNNVFGENTSAYNSYMNQFAQTQALEIGR